MNTPIASAHSAKLALFVENLRVQGSSTLRAFGTSMCPAILPGDLITIRRTDVSAVKPGDIVAFTRDHRLFVHRAVRAYQHSGAAWVVTRGDALDVEDGPIRESEFLGTVDVADTHKHRSILRQILSYRIILFMRYALARRSQKNSCAIPGKFLSAIAPLQTRT